MGAFSSYAQDMLYMMRILDSIQLQLKNPVKLLLNNKKAVDLSQNWYVEDVIDI